MEKLRNSYHKTFNQDNNNTALLALSTASIIWGIGIPVLKWTLEITPLFLFGLLRFGIASILLYILLRPSLFVHKKDIPTLVLSSLLGVAIHIILVFWGLRLTSAIDAALITTSGPLLTLVIVGVLFREKITKNLTIGGLIGFIGVGIIMISPLADSSATRSTILGNILLLLSVATWIAYELIAKRTLFTKYSPATITFYSFVITSVSFLPFAAPEILHADMALLVEPRFVIGLIFSTFFASTIGFSLWQWGLSKTDVSKAAFFIYLDPIAASITSSFLLHEVITPQLFFGALFVFAGLYIAEKHLHFPHFHIFHVLRR